jgi:Uma2 family endonuclease
MTHELSILDQIRVHPAFANTDVNDFELRTHVGVQYDDINVCCHDMAAWHKSRLDPDSRRNEIVHIRPDWVCDVVDDRDFHYACHKREILHRWGVPLIWVVNPQGLDLTVLNWARDDYTETHFHWQPVH